MISFTVGAKLELAKQLLTHSHLAGACCVYSRTFLVGLFAHTLGLHKYVIRKVEMGGLLVQNSHVLGFSHAVGEEFVAASDDLCAIHPPWAERVE